MAGDAEPDAIREYTRQFLRSWGCVIKRAWDTDGFLVEPSKLLQPSTLNLFLAASRSFYQTMIEGEWDEEHRTREPLYPFENPMYSPVLRRWKREHRFCCSGVGRRHRRPPAGLIARQPRRIAGDVYTASASRFQVHTNTNRCGTASTTR